MNFSKRIEHLEALQASGGGKSRIDPSLLTDSELQELMDKRASGGRVETQAYGPLEFKPQNNEVKNDYKI